MKSEQMLLFINVALGLSMGSGISAFASNNIQSDSWNVTLELFFLMFVLNIVRHFLGFVKFYSDQTLREEKWVGKVDEPLVYCLKAVDFAVVVASLVFLYLMGNVISRPHDFSHYLFVDSELFLVRDIVLLGFIPELPTNTALRKTFRIWLLLDFLFLLISAGLMFTSSPLQFTMHNLVMGWVFAIILLTIGDLAGNARYYFD